MGADLKRKKKGGGCCPHNLTCRDRSGVAEFGDTLGVSRLASLCLTLSPPSPWICFSLHRSFLHVVFTVSHSGGLPTMPWRRWGPHPRWHSPSPVTKGKVVSSKFKNRCLGQTSLASLGLMMPSAAWTRGDDVLAALPGRRFAWDRRYSEAQRVVGDGQTRRKLPAVLADPEII